MAQASTIKPIETRYAGRRFRSRLEARYAVIFQTLGLRWDYEPEGFELGAGLRYLPDFFVHTHPEFAPMCGESGYWVEIKATRPTDFEIQKLVTVVRHTTHMGLLIWGSPNEAKAIFIAPRQRWPAKPEGVPFNGLQFVVCLPLPDRTKPPTLAGKVQRAIVEAMSARFEFGDRA